MENEVQKRRTYEILSKYIGEQQDIKVELNDEGKVAANPKDNTIFLPRNVKADNIYPALAWLIHESHHIKHTKHIDADKIIDDEVDFHILNACEDARIDQQAFHLLPNVKGFYREMIKLLNLKERANNPDIPIEVKVLSDCILKIEGFTEATSHNPHIEAFIRDTNLLCEIERLTRKLDDIEWTQGNDMFLFKEAKKQVKVIRDLLSNIKKQQKQNQPQQQNGQGKGKGKPDSQNQGQDTSNGQGDKSADVSQQGTSNDKLDLSKMPGGGVSQAVFGQLDKNAINPSIVGSAALHERTESALKEILNQKEIQRIEEGTALNTDNLTAFYTGDIDELFTEEITVRKKKSKLLLVLDSSGSMRSRLMDKTLRHDTLASTAQAITKILDEVHQLEGINVDYGIRRFDSGYYELSKDNWVKEYTSKIGGGTCLETAFESAQEELLKDYTIEGKRLIILITDGEVWDEQINNIKKSIIKHNADVRAMVLGVGATVNSSFIKQISGHNILTKDLADVVLMEAIQEMLA